MFFNQQRVQSFRQGGLLPINNQKWKGFSQYCRHGRIFDDKHFNISGQFCRHKHRLFRWNGVNGRNVTLLSDSLCKWVRSIRNTDVQAIPGLNLDRLIDRINDYTLYVSNYRLIVLNVGTNNLVMDSQEEIIQKLTNVIEVIRAKNPNAGIAVNSIFFRPQDIPEQMLEIKMRKITRGTGKQPKSSIQPSSSTDEPQGTTSPPPPKKSRTEQEIYQSLHPMERKRRSVNKAIRKLCTTSRCLFLESWRCVMHKKTKEVNLNLFADDGLHLNQDGIAAMSEFIEGNIQRLIPAAKTPKKRKRKQQKNKQKAA
jgi:hypothetical protein